MIPRSFRPPPTFVPYVLHGTTTTFVASTENGSGDEEDSVRFRAAHLLVDQGNVGVIPMVVSGVPSEAAGYVDAAPHTGRLEWRVW